MSPPESGTCAWPLKGRAVRSPTRALRLRAGNKNRIGQDSLLGAFQASSVPLFCLVGTGRVHPFLLATIVGFLAAFPAMAQPAVSNRAGIRFNVAAQGSTAPGFKLMDPRQTGLVFTNLLSEKEGAANRTLYNGSGVATGDLDGDGLPDLVFAKILGGIEIFRNLGGWRFSNITLQAGLAGMTVPSRGVVLADVDGDGALDLLVSTNGKGVQCWRNKGGGVFVDATVESATASLHGSTTLALADVDGNGSLDLYITNNRADDIRDQGQVQLRMLGGKLIVPKPLENRLVIIDGQPQEYGEPDRLLLNDGEGRFKEISWMSGTFLDESGRPLVRPPLDWGLSAAFRDLNGDGAPDLYVCNDFWTPDRLWMNDGAGRFRLAPELSLRHTSGSSMGVDLADLNADGLPEIFVVDMLSRLPSWRKRQLAAQPARADPPGLVANRPQILRNTLFQARGDGTYAEIAERAGLAAAEWAWQPVFLDVDLDGHQDVLITTGHMHDVQDRDAEAIVRSRQRSFQGIADPEERRRAFHRDLLENMLVYPALRTPILAFRNRGGLSFEDVTSLWGTEAPGVHHGIATADFDGDGDLDLAVNNLNSGAALYRNEAIAPRVAVRLRGSTPNTQAIGAIVTIEGGAAPKQTQEVVSGGRYLSGSDPLLVYAAGRSDATMTLEVRWRTGRVRRIEGVQASRLYEIQEDSVQKDPFPGAIPAGEVKPLFEDISHWLKHTHLETWFDDFARQPLLPRRFSQLGPGVAWADLDGDGWEDLIIGTGAGGTVAAYKNERGERFTKWTQAPFSQGQARDTTGLAAFPGAGGRPILLTGTANYEDSVTNAACVFELALDAMAPRPFVRDLPSSVGPLALADMDADGDLDLFIGARVTRGRWPEAKGSLVLRRDGDAWRADEVNTKVLDGIGSVCGAVWTDLNRDGFPDLVVAGEWSPLRIFRNEKGLLVPWDWRIRSSDKPGAPVLLSTLTGLWNSVAAGDFDGDGQMDLIAGNWGENSAWRASLEQPLTLLAGSWRGLESLALIETEFDPVRQALTPSRPLPDLVSELPFLAGKFATHHAYAEATLSEVLGPAEGEVNRYSATTLKSTLFLNRGGEFVVRELPAEAQNSPVFGMTVADFDGNGAEDVFLAQNFFAVRPGDARLDAGQGLLLLGDGRGKLHPASGDFSGLRIHGEQRGAATADIDHDGRPDLVVAQNGSATRLFRNQSASVGIRLKLRGTPGNPDGVGAVVRLGRRGHFGPAREIHAGAGYWSQDAVVSILSRQALTNGGDLIVEVRWPGGKLTSHTIPENAREHAISQNVP